MLGPTGGFYAHSVRHSVCRKLWMSASQRSLTPCSTKSLHNVIEAIPSKMPGRRFPDLDPNGARTMWQRPPISPVTELSLDFASSRCGSILSGGLKPTPGIRPRWTPLRHLAAITAVITDPCDGGRCSKLEADHLASGTPRSRMRYATSSTRCRTEARIAVRSAMRLHQTYAPWLAASATGDGPQPWPAWVSPHRPGSAMIVTHSRPSDDGSWPWPDESPARHAD